MSPMVNHPTCFLGRGRRGVSKHWTGLDWTGLGMEYEILDFDPSAAVCLSDCAVPTVLYERKMSALEQRRSVAIVKD